MCLGIMHFAWQSCWNTSACKKKMEVGQLLTYTTIILLPFKDFLKQINQLKWVYLMNINRLFYLFTGMLYFILKTT